MPFKFNPLTSQLDLVNATATGSGVIGPSSSTDEAIARWDGTTGNLLQDSSAILRDSGSISSTGFVTKRTVTGTVTIYADETWIAPALTLAGGSTVILNGDSQLILI